MDHTRGLCVDSDSLDNCFTGWEARHASPATRRPTLTIEAGGLFRHLIVYSPPARDYFCVEPVSHMTDAINRMDDGGTGLRVLAPGETLRGEVNFRLATAS